MAELYLDIHFELDPLELARTHRPDQAVAEIARLQAEELAGRRGAVLRHSVPIEVHTRSGLEALSGRAVVLVATRWVADGPA